MHAKTNWYCLKISESIVVRFNITRCITIIIYRRNSNIDQNIAVYVSCKFPFRLSVTHFLFNDTQTDSADAIASLPYSDEHIPRVPLS